MELSRIYLAVLRAGGRPKIPGKGQGLASSSTVVCTICPRVGIGLSDWPKMAGENAPPPFPSALLLTSVLFVSKTKMHCVIMFQAPLYTKLTLMYCGIGNTNLLASSSSVLGYDYFYMKSTDGATMYFNLGSGIGSGRIQTDY